MRSHIGEGADRLLPAFLPKGASKARKKEIEDYRSHLFKTDFLPRVQPFPKVKELFERIKKDGRKVALASSCAETHRILRPLRGLCQRNARIPRRPLRSRESPGPTENARGPG